MTAVSSPGLRLVELRYDDRRWVDFTSTHPAATIFHSPAWVRLLAETYRYRGFALGIMSDERLVGLIPTIEVGGLLRAKRWVSLPFTDVCPPLLGSEAEAASVVSLLEGVRNDAGVSAIDLHAGLDGAAPEQNGVEHVLALEDDADALERRFKAQHRQQVRQAERNGVKTRVARSADDLIKSYYTLHVATRRRLGVPTQPRAFFERLWESILEPGQGFLLLAEHDGTTAGGAVFLTGSSTLMYKYSASDPSLRKLRPNNLILATAVRWGSRHGCTQLHFGRSDLHNSGLRSFKSGWGAEERPLVYSRIGNDSVRKRASEPGAALSYAIRKSPPIVCRGLGKAFYRYAA